jgi:hypothetical protein
MNRYTPEELALLTEEERAMEVDAQRSRGAPAATVYTVTVKPWYIGREEGEVVIFLIHLAQH